MIGIHADYRIKKMICERQLVRVRVNGNNKVVKTRFLKADMIVRCRNPEIQSKNSGLILPCKEY